MWSQYSSVHVTECIYNFARRLRYVITGDGVLKNIPITGIFSAKKIQYFSAVFGTKENSEHQI